MTQNPNTCAYAAGVAFKTTGPDGRVAQSIRVSRFIARSTAPTIDCAIEGNCILAGYTPAPNWSVDAIPIVIEPAPPLEIEIIIDNVDAATISGTRTCSFDTGTRAQTQISLTQNEQGSSGFAYDSIAAGSCTTEPTQWSGTIPIAYIDPPLQPGSVLASVEMTMSIDGVEYQASDQRVLELDDPPQFILPDDFSDDSVLTVSNIRTITTQDRLQVAFDINCLMPLENETIYVRLQKRTNPDLLLSGALTMPACNGPQSYVLDTDADPYDNRHQAGEAYLRLTIQTSAYGGPTYFRLVDLEPFGPDRREPINQNAQSRVHIDGVSAGSVSGTIDCGEAKKVTVVASLAQTRETGFAYASGNVKADCVDGTAAFAALVEARVGEFDNDLAVARVWAVGTTKYWFNWLDFQKATVEELAP